MTSFPLMFLIPCCFVPFPVRRICFTLWGRSWLTWTSGVCASKRNNASEKTACAKRDIGRLRFRISMTGWNAKREFRRRRACVRNRRRKAVCALPIPICWRCSGCFKREESGSLFSRTCIFPQKRSGRCLQNVVFRTWKTALFPVNTAVPKVTAVCMQKSDSCSVRDTSFMWGTTGYLTERTRRKQDGRAFSAEMRTRRECPSGPWKCRRLREAYTGDW